MVDSPEDSQAPKPHRPIVSWAAISVTSVAYFLTNPTRDGHDALRLIEWGANAPGLVMHGEWYRLIAANFLSLSLFQLLANLTLLAILGTYLERFAGSPFMLLTLAAGCLAGQGVAAALWPFAGNAAVYAGFDAGTCAVMGALAVLAVLSVTAFQASNAAARKTIVRLALWLALGVLAHLPQGNHLAQIAGCAVGALCGALLAIHRSAPGRLGGIAQEAAILAGAVILAGLAANAWHLMDPARRRADHLIALQSLAHYPAKAPFVLVDLANSLIYDRQSPPDALRAARAAIVAAAPSWPSMGLHGGAGLLAGIDARLSETDGPPAPGTASFWPPAPSAENFQSFLSWIGTAQTPLVQQEAGAPPPPSLSLGQATIRVAAAAPLPLGARLYAWVRGADGVRAGLLTLVLPPGFAGQQILPLPVTRTAPSITPPPPLWTDPATTLQIAYADLRGCRCDPRYATDAQYWETMGPSFSPLNGPATP